MSMWKNKNTVKLLDLWEDEFSSCGRLGRLNRNSSSCNRQRGSRAGSDTRQRWSDRQDGLPGPGVCVRPHAGDGQVSCVLRVKPVLHGTAGAWARRCWAARWTESGTPRWSCTAGRPSSAEAGLSGAGRAAPRSDSPLAWSSSGKQRCRQSSSR